MTAIRLSSKPEVLAADLAKFPKTATVEAEFGATVVPGSIVTLAHHAEAYRKCASPCTRENDALMLNAIGVSHIDLDTVGGVLSLLGTKPGNKTFWDLAGQVDVRGVHRLAECATMTSATPEDVRGLRAFHAWSEKNRVFPNRDGSVSDAAPAIESARLALTLIFGGDEALLTAGDEFLALQDALDAESFVKTEGGVIFRNSEKFVNHLYAHSGTPEKAVVGFNAVKGVVTVSFADAEADGGDACAIVQSLWGPKAGGHKGIAGGPREVVLGENDALEAFKAAKAMLATR